MIEEGILAEQAGFHSIQVPDRHGRTESYFGSPLNLLMILAHETEKVALGSYCLVNTLYTRCTSPSSAPSSTTSAGAGST